MRAWRITEYGEPAQALALIDVPDPIAPRAGVVVEVEAMGLNYPDVMFCRGTYHERPELPFTPGLEVCGRIVAAGDASRWGTGERVVGASAPPEGGLAELVPLPDDRVYEVADDVDVTTAAGMFITYQTAYLALHRRARLASGEVLLVFGASGGVGSAALQLGKAAGARVIAVAGGEAKTERCRQLGADEVIDHLTDDVPDAVKMLTNGVGAAVVFDPVGGSAFEAGRRCIAFEGRIVAIGFASGDIPTVAAGHVLVKNYAVVGMHWTLYQRRAPEVVREAHGELQRLLRAGAIDPAISRVVSFREVPAALSDLGERRAWGSIVARL